MNRVLFTFWGEEITGSHILAMLTVGLVVGLFIVIAKLTSTPDDSRPVWSENEERMWAEAWHVDSTIASSLATKFSLPGNKVHAILLRCLQNDVASIFNLSAYKYKNAPVFTTLSDATLVRTLSIDQQIDESVVRRLISDYRSLVVAGSP